MTKGMLLDLIYARVNHLIASDKLSDLDKMFRFSKETDLDMMLGLLTASLPVKSRLPSRPSYFKAVESLCLELGATDPTILKGLA